VCVVKLLVEKEKAKEEMADGRGDGENHAILSWHEEVLRAEAAIAAMQQPIVQPSPPLILSSSSDDGTVHPFLQPFRFTHKLWT
jgi:hypothetical protein